MADKKSKKKKAKRSRPKLCVAFDTNVLYTHLAHHLLRREVKALVESNSDHNDLRIEWFLSDVVTRERQYQMGQRADQLHTNIEQLEKLLGYQITTREIVSDRIRAVIDEQLTELNIQLLALDNDEVDWADVIRRSVQRLPPFDPSNKEKGFRDAVIAEAFVQLVDRSPTTAASCRLVFVSNDELVRRYVSDRVEGSQNVRVLENLNELEGLINTLVSNVPEEKIEEWKKKAQAYFFEKGDESTLFYREEVRNKLAEEFSKELKDTPDGVYMRQPGTWYINEPVFIKKERQRLHWMTEIEAHSKLYSLTDSDTSLSGGLFGLGAASQDVGRALAIPSREEAGSARSTMEVYWSVSVSSTRETLSKPSLDSLEFKETEFEVTQSSANTLAKFLKDYSPES